MPAVAVIGQAVRTTHTRNGAVTSSAIEHASSNGHNQCDTLRGGGVTPAWKIPENGQKQQNGKTEGGTLHKQLSAYRRWMSKNKVGHGSQQSTRPVDQRNNRLVDNVSRFLPSQKYRETPSAAAILYMGIGMVFVGMVITFVGLGEKGFQTWELKLIGPSLIGLGFIICGIRILICCCADKCSYCDQEIQREDPNRSKSSSAGSGRSLPGDRNGQIKSNRINSTNLAIKPMFRSVTPIPFPLSPGPASSAPQLPSTSTRVSLEDKRRRTSWDDTSSIDFDCNTTSPVGSPQHKPHTDNSSSIVSGELSDDNNEFCEIELKKASSPPQPPSSVKSDKETSTTNNNLAITLTDPKSTSEIPKNNDNSIDDQLSISVNGDKSNCLSTGVVLDPQQYLRRATLAASSKTIR